MIQIKIIQQGEATAKAPPQPTAKRLTFIEEKPQLYRITAVAWRAKKQIRNQCEPWLTTEYWAKAWAEELKEMHRKDRYIISVELYFTEKEIIYYSNF